MTNFKLIVNGNVLSRSALSEEILERRCVRCLDESVKKTKKEKENKLIFSHYHLSETMKCSKRPANYRFTMEGIVSRSMKQTLTTFHNYIKVNIMVQEFHYENVKEITVEGQTVFTYKTTNVVGACKFSHVHRQLCYRKMAMRHFLP